MSACFREEKREREEQALKERENISNQEDPQAADEDEETKAAVVLQSNYRGFKERKKLKEKKKSMAGDQPQLGRHQETTNGHDERQEDMEEEEESTYKAEEGDDSDHTQVPEDEELVEMDGDALEGGFISLEEETRAATVLQSNFRGHKERKRLQEEGKIPARQEQQTRQEGAGEICSQIVDVAAVEVSLEEQEEVKAAVVLQSNFRGHKERKRLQEEGKIPEEKKKEEERKEGVLPQEDDGQPGLDEEKAATVLQSNFRGHRERQKLREEREMKEKAKEMEEEEGEEVVEEDTLDLTHVVLERRDEADAERERLEEEQAAVKIQSNFRGYKDRKNLKDAAQLQAEQLENFSRQVGPTPSAAF